MRAGPARASFGLAHLIVLGILVQAVLAGFFLNGQPELVTLHFHVGSTLLLLSVLSTVLVALARFERRDGLLPLAAVQTAALVAQFMLGFAGRESATAAAVHVPLAFVVFALAMLGLFKARRALRELKERR